jgi:trehalose-6-phosphatase
MRDALGNKIVIGNKYGYSQQSSGSVTIVTGFVEKINELKVTLVEVSQRRGLYGEIAREFSKENRKRTVNACHLFPILFNIGDDVTCETGYKHSEKFKVSGVYLELSGDWSGGTQATYGSSKINIQECKHN